MAQQLSEVFQLENNEMNSLQDTNNSLPLSRNGKGNILH